MRTLSLHRLTLPAVFGLILISTLSACAFNPNATASAAAKAQVEILKPARIINVNGTGLSFGSIVPVVSGTVTVTPGNIRTSTGVSVVPGSSYAAAAFEVSGIPGSTYTISLPSSTIIYSGAHSMTVDGFSSNPAGSGLLDSNGNGNFNVGAVLHVDINQPVGQYQGTFTVMVAYN